MSTLPLIPTIGVPELLIILVIVLIFFGVGKLPQIGKALGQGIKGFKEGAKGEDDAVKGQIDVEDRTDPDHAETKKEPVERDSSAD